MQASSYQKTGATAGGEGRLEQQARTKEGGHKNLRPRVQAAGQQAKPGHPWASGHPVAFGYNQTVCARDKVQLRSVPRLGRGTALRVSVHVSGSQVWHCYVWSTSTGGWIQAQDPMHQTRVMPGTQHDVQCPWAETG